MCKIVFSYLQLGLSVSRERGKMQLELPGKVNYTRKNIDITTFVC